MSIWKFRLYLIPKKVLFGKYNAVPSAIPQDLAFEYRWWADVQPAVGFESQLEPTLPVKESWSESLRIWGWDVGGDVQIWYADESRAAVEEIQFRIDSRKVSQDLVRLMCNISKQLDCVLLTSRCKILLPDESGVMAAFNESTAAKFVIDPVAALEELDVEVIRIDVKKPRKQ